MKNILPALLISISLFSCESSDTDPTDYNIKGKWQSACQQLPLSLVFNTSLSELYFNQTYTYNDYSVLSATDTYSDSNCQTLDGTDISHLLSTNTTPESYVKGADITTANGVSASVIYITMSNGNLIEDIYSFNHNGKTLVFGKRSLDEYFACFPSNTPSSLNGAALGPAPVSCSRPTELDYEKSLSRLTE